MHSEKSFRKTIQINAPTSKVWEALTNPELMKLWMSEDEINISTNWKIGSPFIVTGDLHGIKFENKGIVLKFEKEKTLSYNHLSSISELPDEIENYSIAEFELESLPNETILTIILSNFPDEIIYKHLVLYWNGTLEEMKKFVETE